LCSHGVFFFLLASPYLLPHIYRLTPEAGETTRSAISVTYDDDLFQYHDGDDHDDHNDDDHHHNYENDNDDDDDDDDDHDHDHDHDHDDDGDHFGHDDDHHGYGIKNMMV
jgi:hypothetical protein